MWCRLVGHERAPPRGEGHDRGVVSGRRRGGWTGILCQIMADRAKSPTVQSRTP